MHVIKVFKRALISQSKPRFPAPFLQTLPQLVTPLKEHFCYLRASVYEIAAIDLTLSELSAHLRNVSVLSTQTFHKCTESSDSVRSVRYQSCKYTTLVDIQKRAIKTSHSCRITCERSESARERRIELYKSSHHHHL